MIQRHHTTFFITESGDVFVYYCRCTLENKCDFNYGKERKVHWHEEYEKLTKEQIKKQNPHSEIYSLPDSRVSKFHINKISELMAIK